MSNKPPRLKPPMTVTVPRVDDLRPAASLSSRFHALLEQLDDLSAEIEAQSPEQVARRGVVLTRSSVAKRFDQAFEGLGYVSEFLHQCEKIEHRVASGTTNLRMC